MPARVQPLNPPSRRRRSTLKWSKPQMWPKPLSQYKRTEGLLDVSPPIELPCVTENLYTPQELAKQWKLSVDYIRSLFEHEPGVMILQHRRRGIRRYRTMRIPASVARRVYNRLVVPAA